MMHMCVHYCGHLHAGKGHKALEASWMKDCAREGAKLIGQARAATSRFGHILFAPIYLPNATFGKRVNA